MHQLMMHRMKTRKILINNLEVYLVKFPHAVWVCIAMGSFNAKVGTITKIGKRGGNMALYRDEQQWQKAYTNMQ